MDIVSMDLLFHSYTMTHYTQIFGSFASGKQKGNIFEIG